MRKPLDQTTVKILHGIEEIDEKVWDSCANASSPFNPFLSHRFLLALEKSKSVAPESGWQPFHLLVEKGKKLIGVVPMYLKSHSQGEFVFDYGWADAWQRAGGSYYPKLQCSVPFTPATGPRLLARDPSPENLNTLVNATIEVAQKTKVSSLHMTFMQKDQWEATKEQGFLSRIDQQFHWHNAGYETFDDFLGDLASKKRKNLKRERRGALENDISIEWATGDSIAEEHWDAFYHFYVDTGARKWGSPYLTREFFSLIGENIPQDILLIMAKRNDAYIAGALNFIGGDTLFGRNWGCIEDHRFLHFEVCYYQAIDFAIQHNLKKVEAGAQGSHKVARGYLPQATYSAHWISDPNFKDAVKRFLDDERKYVEEDIAYIETRSPFSSNTDIERLRSIEIKS